MTRQPSTRPLTLRERLLESVLRGAARVDPEYVETVATTAVRLVDAVLRLSEPTAPSPPPGPVTMPPVEMAPMPPATRHAKLCRCDAPECVAARRAALVEARAGQPGRNGPTVH